MSKLSQTLARFLQNHFGRFWMVVVYLFLYTPLVFLILPAATFGIGYYLEWRPRHVEEIHIVE